MNTKHWSRHFAKNALGRHEPDWGAPMKLSGKTLHDLRRSIQQFQLGDGGGPAYLISWNRDRILTEPDSRKLIDLWFAEEREHSRLLGCMLRRLGGEEIKQHWSFTLFCGVRKWLGLDFELYALLLTEIVSHVYYKMLNKHGSDEALKQMCSLIIRDEAGHIAFHRARLAEEATAHPRRFGKTWSFLFRLRGLAAGTVLWINHRNALRNFGATDAEFYRWISRDMAAFIRVIRKHAGRTRQSTGAVPLSQGACPLLGERLSPAACPSIRFPSPLPRSRRK